MSLIDSYGRKINYLRLSVTERCNLRCQYCMPPEGVSKLSHNDILSFEELLLAARTAVSMGIEKIRITGGEPLVRKGLVGFLARLAAIPGLKELALTTNGLLLEEMAAELRNAGVQRLNISLDSFRRETFSRITRGGEVERVLAGIAAADKAGFPIKLNMVVMRGVNDAELLEFARLTLKKPYAVRFIEYMPTIKEQDWQSLLVPGCEILELLSRHFTLREVGQPAMAGPSRNFQIENAKGTVGVITPLTGHFCTACNRVRLTATGTVRSCLFSDQEYDLKPFLRFNDESAVRVALRRIVRAKPEKHHVSVDGTDHQLFAMSSVGG